MPACPLGGPLAHIAHAGGLLHKGGGRKVPRLGGQIFRRKKGDGPTVGFGQCQQPRLVLFQINCGNAPDRFCYRGTALPTSVFTVTLAEAGEYTVQIQADRFIGSYGFAWKTF